MTVERRPNHGLTNWTFGLKEAMPPGVSAAWGARWIFPNEQLWDRQSWYPPAPEDEPRVPLPKTPKRALMDWLNAGALDKAQATALQLANTAAWSSQSDETVMLHRDAQGMILGNPRRSYGYVYVCAFRFDALPEGQAMPVYPDARTLLADARPRRSRR